MTTRIAIGFAFLVTLAACSSTGSRPQTAVAQNVGCTTPSASRIPDDNRCVSSGASYSGEDIRRTGKTNAGEALQILDPSITVHR